MTQWWNVGERSMLLLTNDDGIEAPGLAALERAVAGREYVVVAPMGAMSECSHCVTTRKTFKVERRGERRWAVEGTPADCVRVALLHVLPELGVDREGVRVLSGINAGGNLGADVYISGTVAAVREAAFFEVWGMALSQYRKAMPGEAEWARASGWAKRVIGRLWEERMGVGEFWNVNFPWTPPAAEEPEVVVCERSRRPLPVKYQAGEGGIFEYTAGLYHTRGYEAGSDIDVCFGGRISASRIAI